MGYFFMRNRTRFLATTAVATALGLSVVGCTPPNTSETAGLSIVASTNVWGDVAQSIAGDNATVTSIITSSVQDPHSYEASARDQLAISNADLVIENGGGYDPFIDALVAASADSANLVVLNASEASGLMPTETATGDTAKEEPAAEEPASGAPATEEGHDDHDHVAGFN
jgi:zinc/manganese transport system substrate-binding protein